MNTQCRRRARIGLLCLVAAFVGQAPASTAAAQLPGPPLPRVVLLGAPSLPLGLAAKTIQDSGRFTVRVNADVDSAELVLFVVHGPDGPMRPGIEAIERRAGQKLARAAILVTGADLQDAELLQLVLLETREVLGRYLGEEAANRLEVLKMPDADLVPKLEALLFLPPIDLRIAAPPR
jgi:hypothetical protein